MTQANHTPSIIHGHVEAARVETVSAIATLEHLLRPGYYRTSSERGCALIGVEALLEAALEEIGHALAAHRAEPGPAPVAHVAPSLFGDLLAPPPNPRDALGPVPEEHVARCASAACKARIVWLEKPGGKAHPVDADTVKAGDREYDKALGHVSHFATCPDRERFARKAAK